LDLSKASLGPSGGEVAAHILGLEPCRHLENLDISDQAIGPEGAAAVASAVASSSSLLSVRLKGCGLGNSGGAPFVELLQQGALGARLAELDLQNNFLGFQMCEALERAAKEEEITVLLAGNRVLDEVLNAATHGIGTALAVAGIVRLSQQVQGKPARYKLSVISYGVALNVLYLSSTLYHSFFALGPTMVQIFGVLDHCAIYLLIAGTYCPFLWIMFPRDVAATRLLAVLWVAALAGMLTTAFYHGPGKEYIGLTLYLGMGWSCLTRIGELMRRLGPQGTRLLVAGGLCYTGGVPFFVKNLRSFGVPDHTTWHLFVLAGSITHYFCVLWYCIPFKAATPAASIATPRPAFQGQHHQ